MVRIVVFIAALTALAMRGASAQTAANVAVVINDQSAASQRVGDYYARQRAIPAGNIIRVKASDAEEISLRDYLSQIERPIADALKRGLLQDRVLYIVLTKGVPLRITGTPGPNGTVGSVDSELALLYRRLAGGQTRVAGTIDNPYYLAGRPVGELKPFTHRDYDIYLVTRIDGFTADDAIALVDRAKAAGSEGEFVLDLRAALTDRTGEDWLEAAAQRLRAAGRRVVLETTPRPVRDAKGVLGYYSWGSNDPANRVRRVHMGFVPGALAATFVSTDARTMREPPPEWMPAGDWDRRTSWHEGSPQTLTGDLIREGVTGAAGHVFEPYLRSTVRPEILFPAYVAGRNLAESFYAGIPHLSWQTVVFGDPLCAPFSRRAAAPADVDPPVDRHTGLPGFIAARRIANARRNWPGVPDPALAVMVRAAALEETREDDRARAALEEAIALAPGAAAAHVQLAALDQRTGRVIQAIDRYKRALQLQPNNVLALNNLAYALAVDAGSPKEALPFAQRAAKLAPRSPAVLDTLAWVHHLLGDRAAAVRLVAAARRAAPDNAEIVLHAAFINEAAGAAAVARDAVTQAITLDPSFGARPDVRALRERLQKDVPSR